jgi:hypothetical protein
MARYVQDLVLALPLLSGANVKYASVVPMR